MHNVLHYWRSDLQGRRVLLFVDNITFIHLVRSGSSRSSLLMTELRQVWSLLRAVQIDLQTVHITTDLNPAEKPIRHRHRDVWTLREGYRRQIRALDRPFSLDLSE